MKNKGAIAGAIIWEELYFFLGIRCYYYCYLLVNKEIILPDNNFGLIGHDFRKLNYAGWLGFGSVGFGFLVHKCVVMTIPIYLQLHSQQLF